MKIKGTVHAADKARAKGYTNCIRNNLANKTITEEEAKLLEAFVSEVNGQNNVTNSRKYILVKTCVDFRKILPPFKTCDNEDIFRAIEEYRNTTDHNPTHQRQYIATFKQFLIWLIESENNTILSSDRIRKIKIGKQNTRLTEKDVMIGDELERMYKACKSFRDRTLFEVLYESGGRINEICTLRWEDITFHDTYATVELESKTDKPRLATLITSVSRLKQWKDQYPTGADGDKFVFFGRASTPNKHITYQTVVKIIKAAVKTAGITKNITAHSFRHTRITDLLRAGYTHSDICMQMWGTPTGEMLKVYAHLTPMDTVNNMLRHAGVKSRLKMDNPLPDAATPVQCENEKCRLVNPKTNKFCHGCGKALTKGVESIYEETLRMIQQQPEFRRAIEAGLLSMELTRGEA